MKKLINKLLLVVLVATLAISCEKDEVRTVLTPGNAPTLTASATTLNLLQANAANDAITLSWTPAEYGFKAAVIYSLQFSKKGTNWAPASSSEMSLGTALSKKFTVVDFNKELLKFLPASQVSDVDVRIKADVATGVTPVYSNVVSLQVTPYRDIITYTFPQAINLAGNFQNWTPATGPQIVSKATNGQYEGFIDFGTTAAPEFKMVKGNDWSAGDYGGSTGTLTNGGGNLMLSSGGVHFITANTTTMKWTSAKINSWGLIGDAIAVTEWNSDKDMTYNALTKTWSITLDLIGGKNIKFRANDAWDINLGDAGNDGKPDLGVNDNIPVATSGNYTVTLDILIGGNWSYTLKKN
ncbi:MAG: hypothetical protein JWQ96_2116 [Segetibacter sp.]|nr:hypothetical protein [Segetibacter sp.]